LPINDWLPDIAGCVASIEVVMKKETSGDGESRPRAQTEALEQERRHQLDYESYG
jgi:hypothetical protein